LPWPEGRFIRIYSLIKTHPFMKTLKTILFICALVLSCGLTAQTFAPKQIVQHLEVVPGQEQASLDFLKMVKDAYSVNPQLLEQPLAVYQYDDSSIDLILEVKDMAGSDRLDAVMDQALMSLPAEKRADLWNIDRLSSIVTSWHDEVKRSVKSFSYEPEDPGFEGPAPYVEVVTYRHKMVDLGKIRALAAEAVALSKKHNMQQQHQFVVNTFGGEPNTFQIVYQAKSAEDMARRRAADGKLATAEQKAWGAKVMPLVEEVSRRTGRYVPELSTEVENKTSNIFFVVRDEFPAGKAKELTEVYGKLKTALRAAGSDFYWNADYMQDGTVYSYLPIDRMSDLDVVVEEMYKRAYQLKPEDQLGAAFSALPYTRTTWVAEYHPEWSYSDPIAQSPDKFTHFAQVEYTCAPEDWDKMLEINKEAIKLNRDAKTTQPFQVFSYALGGPSNVVAVRYLGTSMADLTTRSEQSEKALGAAFGPLMKKLREVATASKPVYGRQAPELSYRPTPARK